MIIVTEKESETDGNRTMDEYTASLNMVTDQKRATSQSNKKRLSVI